MSYSPTTWQTGDTVTAAKLNNMETGIDAAVNPFIVNLTPAALDYSGTMDKTISQINAAVSNGRTIIFQMDLSGMGIGMESIQFNGNVIEKHIENGNTLYSVSGEFVFETANSIVLVSTPSSFVEDGYYSTVIYTLTPAS